MTDDPALEPNQPRGRRPTDGAAPAVDEDAIVARAAAQGGASEVVCCLRNRIGRDRREVWSRTQPATRRSTDGASAHRPTVRLNRARSLRGRPHKEAPVKWSVFCALALGMGGMGCGGASGPRLDQARPGRLPTDLPSNSAGSDAVIQPKSWHFYTDVERIRKIVVTPQTVWATGQTGIVSWRRDTRAFAEVRSPGSPGGNVTALAVTDAAVIYAGLPSGIAWRIPGKPWQRLQSGPLAGGVTALVPREAGGVWVGMAHGLAWFFDAQVHVISNRYKVRQVVVGPRGVVWVATKVHGVVALRGSRLVEYTVGQGVCGNHVRHLSVGPKGRVLAVCADTHSRDVVSMWDGGRWYAYRLKGVGVPVKSAHALGDHVIIQAGNRYWRLSARVATPIGGPSDGPPAAGAQTANHDPRAVPVTLTDPTEPPLPPAAPAQPSGGPSGVASQSASAESAKPVGPASQATPSSAVPTSAPPPVSTPPPTASNTAPKPPKDAPVPQPAGPVRTERLPSVRAKVRFRGDPTQAPALAIAPFVTGVPVDSVVTAHAHDDAGGLWLASAFRGLLRQSRGERVRYSSQGLTPPHDAARVVATRDGQAILAGRAHLARFRGIGWSHWSLGPPTDVRPLAAAVDPKNQVWVIGHGSQSEDLLLFRSDASDRLRPVGQVPLVEDIAGPPLAGQLVVDARGRLFFSLFWQDARRGIHPVGLATVPPSLDRLDLWRGDIDLARQQVAGTIWLPDAWVNAIAKPSAGDLTYVATNSGLVRVSGDAVKIFDENSFLESEVIFDLAVGPDGRVWAATMEGLGFLVGDTWHSVDHPVVGDAASAVDVDEQGVVWVGADDELWRSTKTGWLKVDLGIAAGSIRDIAHDAAGNVWLLTPRGLFHVQGAVP